jgi:LAO/AO transport system kinase
VLTPVAGDAIQMMKAGILEAADIFIINKADKGDADILKADLEAMLAKKAQLSNEWSPSIVITEAIYDKGTEELAGAIQKHREFLTTSGELKKRQKERIKLELMETIESYLKDFIQEIDRGNYLTRLVDDLVQGKTNPYSAALEITNRLAKELRQLPISGKFNRKLT